MTLLRPLWSPGGRGWSMWPVWPEPAGACLRLPPSAPPWRFPQSPDPTPRTIPPYWPGCPDAVCLGEAPCDHLGYTADVAGCPFCPRTPPLSGPPAARPTQAIQRAAPLPRRTEGGVCPAPPSGPAPACPARELASRVGHSTLCPLGSSASWDHLPAQVPGALPDILLTSPRAREMSLPGTACREEGLSLASKDQHPAR